MHLTTLVLENFRSYHSNRFDFDPHVNFILGPNGCGKTNILEAIYLLATGTSYRAQKLAQLIKWDQNFASVRCQPQDLEIQLISDPLSAQTKRRFLIQSVVKTRRSYLGQLKTVIFHPEDIRLVTGSPSRRRDYLDSVFIQTQWRYASALSQYHRALKHRNQLLDQIRLGHNQPSELFYWDQSLVKNSEIILRFRQSFIDAVNRFFTQHPNSEIQQLRLQYLPSPLTAEKLEAHLKIDILRGHTQIGIHRDDFVFQELSFPAADRDLAGWGSRGQQRLAVLGLKLAEIDYIEKNSGDKPILLLDDIFSELDPDHQQLVTSICLNYQSFFTAADSHLQSLLPSARLINLTIL